MSAIDAFTAEKDNGLQAYELSKREWSIVNQLCKVLKVSRGRQHAVGLLTNGLDPQTSNTFLFCVNT